MNRLDPSTSTVYSSNGSSRSASRASADASRQRRWANRTPLNSRIGPAARGQWARTAPNTASADSNPCVRTASTAALNRASQEAATGAPLSATSPSDEVRDSASGCVAGGGGRITSDQYAAD